MQRRFGAFAVVCASLALPATAAAASKTIYASGPVKFQNSIQKSFGAGVDNFLINRVTINVGDTVVWNGKARANGFHTIDFPNKGGRALPLILPTGKKVSGEVDAAGNPFWFNGLNQLGFNPALLPSSKGGTYNGSKRIDSGLPLKPSDFKLKFTKAGVYKYFCDVHSGMVGFVVVKAKGQKVPTAKADAKTLATEEAAYVASAKKLVKTKIIGANVSLGKAGANGLELFAMLPNRLTVKNGTTVTFSMSAGTREVHTAAFGPTAYVNKLASEFGGGIVFPGQAVYPSDPSITLNTTSHGNGFANTGILDQSSATPLPPKATIKFTQAGTYNFICLVHPFMHGTVVVKP